MLPFIGSFCENILFHHFLIKSGNLKSDKLWTFPLACTRTSRFGSVIAWFTDFLPFRKKASFYGEKQLKSIFQLKTYTLTSTWSMDANLRMGQMFDRKVDWLIFNLGWLIFNLARLINSSELFHRIFRVTVMFPFLESIFCWSWHYSSFVSC